MKKFILFVLITCSLCAPVMSFGAFDEAIEDSQQAKQKSSKNNKSEESSTSNNSDAESSLVELFIEIFGYLWLINAEARYCPYPYSSADSKYLTYNDFIPVEQSENEDYSSPNRCFRFSADTSFLWLKDLAIGNETSFDCMFYPLIGFYARNILLYDHIHNDGSMGNIHLGAIIPIFQTNPLSAYMKAGWTKWYNDVTPLLKESAFFFGFELKSYPFKPLAVKWNFGWQFYENDVFVLDSDLQAGIMLDRFEIFAGWRYLETGTENADSTCWHGTSSGIRIHF